MIRGNHLQSAMRSPSIAVIVCSQAHTGTAQRSGMDGRRSTEAKVGEPRSSATLPKQLRQSGQVRTSIGTCG